MLFKFHTFLCFWDHSLSCCCGWFLESSKGFFCARERSDLLWGHQTCTFHITINHRTFVILSSVQIMLKSVSISDSELSAIRNSNEVEKKINLKREEKWVFHIFHSVPSIKKKCWSRDLLLKSLLEDRMLNKIKVTGPLSLESLKC